MSGDKSLQSEDLRRQNEPSLPSPEDRDELRKLYYECLADEEIETAVEDEITRDDALFVEKKAFIRAERERGVSKAVAERHGQEKYPDPSWKTCDDIFFVVCAALMEKKRQQRILMGELPEPTAPRAVRMAGETREAYEERNKAVSRDFEQGTATQSKIASQLSEFRGQECVPAQKENEPQDRRQKATVTQETSARRKKLWAGLRTEAFSIMDAVDWEQVYQKPQLTWGQALPKELITARPPPDLLRFIRKQKGKSFRNLKIPERFAHLPFDYFPWVISAHIVARRNSKFHAQETKKLKMKVAMLRSMATKIRDEAEQKAEVSSTREEARTILEDMRWMLSTMWTYVRPMVHDIWVADHMRDKRIRGAPGPFVQYVDGLPTNMFSPRRWDILPGSWTSRRSELARWRPCVQCEAAGVLECSSSRFLAANVKKRPCLRCKRLQIVCVRRDPRLEYCTDEKLEKLGWEKWEAYEAADEASLPLEEAQAVAKEALETKRGKKLVSICGMMIDAEDAKGFAPPGSLQRRREQEQSPEASDSDLASSAFAGHALRFSSEISRFKTDEYWEKKAGRFGRGMEDWSGWNRHGVSLVTVKSRKPIPGWLLGI